MNCIIQFLFLILFIKQSLSLEDYIVNHEVWNSYQTGPNKTPFLCDYYIKHVKYLEKSNDNNLKILGKIKLSCHDISAQKEIFKIFKVLDQNENLNLIYNSKNRDINVDY